MLCGLWPMLRPTSRLETSSGLEGPTSRREARLQAGFSTPLNDDNEKRLRDFIRGSLNCLSGVAGAAGGCRGFFAEAHLVFASETAEVEEAPAGGDFGDGGGFSGTGEIGVHVLQAQCTQELHGCASAFALKAV